MLLPLKSFSSFLSHLGCIKCSMRSCMNLIVWLSFLCSLCFNYTDLLLIPQIYRFFPHYKQFLLPKMLIFCTSSHLTSLIGSYFCFKSWFKCHFLKEACALNSQVNLIPLYIFITLLTHFSYFSFIVLITIC